MPRKKYDSRKVNIVGRFFEDITEAILKDVERAPIEDGDFCTWGKGIGIEVKASDNNHELRLPTYQIDTYRMNSKGFPFHSFFFFLFCYDNPYIRAGKLKITSLSQFDDIIEIRSFLAANISTLYVFDISIIDHLFSVGRVSNKSIPLHPGVQSLNLRPSHLKLLADGGWKYIAVKFKNIGIRTFTCEFDCKLDLLESYKIKFQIVVLGQARKIQNLVELFDPKVSLVQAC